MAFIKSIKVIKISGALKTMSGGSDCSNPLGYPIFPIFMR